MVNVIGLGYIGLPTALMLAANGIQVVGTDYNSKVVEQLQLNILPFQEAGLAELFAKANREGIVFSNAYQVTDTYIIAVPTPYDKLSKKIDPNYVIEAIKATIEVAKSGATIVIESTVAPGTIDKFIRPLIENIGKELHIAHAPERIIPGNMVYELIHNSRTIGVDDYSIGNTLKTLYSSFCKGDIVITDVRTAEMTKVVENTYRDINIAFANELTQICRTDNMDVYEIIKIANMHPRVNILQPGPGVGGHCISVDPWFLVGDYPGLANIILAARKINDSMPAFVLNRIYDITKERDIDISRVGLYGLTYKEDVDDIRESPTLQLLECMERHLAPGLKVYDPFIKTKIVRQQISTLNDFLDSVDLVVIMVAHNEIKENIGKLAGKIVLDTRNVPQINAQYKL